MKDKYRNGWIFTRLDCGIYHGIEEDAPSGFGVNGRPGAWQLTDEERQAILPQVYDRLDDACGEARRRNVKAEVFV